MKNESTQLSRLHSLFKNLTTDIGHLERPLDRFDDLLSKIDSTLHFPKKAADDVGSIRKKLTVIDDIVELGAKVPIIGSSCSGVTSILRPMVKEPRPHGMFGKAETILRDIDKDVLSGVKALVSRLKSPVDDARKAVDSIHADAVFIEVQLQVLIKKHGNKVPKPIEECAREIANIVEGPIGKLDDINDFVKDELGTLDDAMQPVQSALKSVEDVFNIFDGIIKKLSNKTVDRVLNNLDRFVKKFEGKAEWFIRAFAKKFKFDPDTIANSVRDLETKISRMITSGIDSEMARLKQQMQDGVNRIPGVDKLESSVNDAKKAFAKLETEIENLTGSACAKTLQLTH